MALAYLPEAPLPLDRPALVEPAPREASFGRVAGTVGPGTHRVVVRVDGRPLGEARVRGARFELHVRLPPRNATVEVRAEDALGNAALTTVGPVLGLHPAARRGDETAADPRLARRLAPLARGFGGVAAVYVEDLETGLGWAWNARALFPAASLPKIAIAVEVLRVLAGPPPRGSPIETALRRMLVDSDNDAANELLRWIGGTEPGGAVAVNRLYGLLRLYDSRLYEGFTAAARGAPIPLRVDEAPPVFGKRVTAWDMARLYRLLHRAAAGEGRLLSLPGAFTAADARTILWILAHSSEQGKLDRFLGRGPIVAEKGGWVSDARHSTGLVYARTGAFVAVVLTWTRGEAGDPSDVLAGRVARAALAWLRERREAPAPLDPALVLGS